MTLAEFRKIEAAPSWWKIEPPTSFSSIHQLAPYIGKLKPAIAQDLVSRFTRPKDLVLDCFSGSGTIPLEAALMGRNVIACDRSSYAHTLTCAKLNAPKSIQEAFERMERCLQASKTRPQVSLRSVPLWVRQFFNSETLRETIQFVDECLEREDHYLIACLLGILHHQRPGFLSYPSSHLVPYLRDKKFPRDQYPEMYTRRELRPRLQAKIERSFKRAKFIPAKLLTSIFQRDVTSLALPSEIDAIITSPPYMNALDYVRDNRLRMWFLDRMTLDYAPEPTDKKEEFDKLCDAFSTNALSRLKKNGYCVLIVGQTVIRSNKRSHPAERMVERIMAHAPNMVPEQIIEDIIPDIRRSRRSASSTKKELILVLKKSK